MPSPALILWADSTRNTLASGWQSNLDASAITLRQGDTLGVELHWVRRTSNLNSVMEEVAWPVSANITLAIGKLDEQPDSGTFAFEYDGDETTALPYNATATQIQTALNALPSIASEGGVAVTQTATSYRILWNTAGVPAGTLAIASNDLTPTSSIGIATARAGSLTARQLTQIHIKQAPVAVCTSWVTQDAPTATITQVKAPAYSGDYRIWRLKISPEPKGGTFRISKTINSVTTFTAPLLALPTSNQIADALGLTVNAVGNNEFEIMQTQVTGEATVNVTALATDDDGMIAYESKYGVLNLNTLDLELMLGGATSATAYLEVEVEVSGTRETLVQRTVTIINDLIDTDSYTLTTWGEVIPADSVVRYDTSQALTTPQKTQARTNIGALGSSDLSAYSTKDTELEGRLGLIETAFTANIQAALSGAASPSSTNVFATANGLAGKANTVHTHAIADVTDLQTTLDAKASTTHTHTIANVTGLQTALDNLDINKAEANHTHIIQDISNLENTLDGIDTNITALQLTAPSTDEKAAMTASENPNALNQFVTQSYLENTSRTAQSNPNTGNLTATVYNQEIVITVNGVMYAIPARII